MPASKRKITCPDCNRVIAASAFVNHCRSKKHHKILDAAEQLYKQKQKEYASTPCGNVKCSNVILNNTLDHLFNLCVGFVVGIPVEKWHARKYCTKSCAPIWNEGLTKENCAQLAVISENRRGSKNPIFKVLADPVAKQAWIDNILAGRKEYDEYRHGKTYDELYGVEKSASIRANQSISAKKRKIHGHTGHKHTIAVKNLLAEKTSKFWSSHKGKASKPQRALYEVLIALFPQEKVILEFHEMYYNIDIAFPDLRFAIEVDGDFWHANEARGFVAKYRCQKFNIINDRKKTTFLQKRGWYVARYWTSEIVENIENVIDRISEEVWKRKLNA